MQLVIEGLSKTYPGGVKALDNISLKIPTGMFGLLGPNGAGKSTLMRTLATLQEADSGSAMLGDIDLLKNKQRSESSRISSTGIRVYPRTSAISLLKHLATLKGVGDNAKHRSEIVDALLYRVNLFDVRHKAVLPIREGCVSDLESHKLF